MVATELSDSAKAELEPELNALNGSMLLDKESAANYKLKSFGSSRVLTTLLSYFSNTVLLWVGPEQDK